MMSGHISSSISLQTKDDLRKRFEKRPLLSREKEREEEREHDVLKSWQNYIVRGHNSEHLQKTHHKTDRVQPVEHAVLDALGKSDNCSGTIDDSRVYRWRK